MTTASLPNARSTRAAALADGEPVVKCAAVTKVFRDFWFRTRVRAVDRVDLEIRRNEVFGLLGPNGSGKSTLIKMILGLLHSSSGVISVLGRRPDDVATKRRIGYLPEESYLYRFLNARETLDYYGRLFHQTRDQRRRRIDMLLEMVGLEHVQHRPVGEYSKGMQRKIGLAQALINDPDLLILDEPTSGMDPLGTADVKRLLKTLAERGKTILFCSHYLADVEDVCDRVAVMFGGKIRDEGTVDQLLTRQGLTNIQTETLDPRTIQEIEQLLSRHGKHIERVEPQRQKLESLFLDIVAKAHAEGVATSGAVSGGRIADFLAEGAKPEGEAVIEELMTAAPAARPGPSPAPVSPRDPASRPDAGALDELIAAAPNAPAKPAPAKQTPPGEKPDEGFLSALMDVPPYKSSDGKGSEGDKEDADRGKPAPPKDR